MTIDGEPVGETEQIQVSNPANGSPVGVAPDCGVRHLDAAMDSASGAFPFWSRDLETRRAGLQSCADVIQANVNELAHMLTLEQGKPLARAKEEVMGAVVWFRYTASLELPVETIAKTDTSHIEVRHRPLGVVAAIAPWNFPLLLAIWKVAPALYAGNTVVLKPSPYTPLATLMMGSLLSNVLPPGVLNVVSGGDELGAQMTNHPTPRKISFTGSVETGKLVAAAAAPDLKRVTLELGGNDPAIVLPGSNPAKIAKDLFWGAFVHNGQTCGAIKRIYVSEDSADELGVELSKIAESVRVGDGLEEGVELGPVNNRSQFERVKELVSAAIGEGASISSGGRARPGKGFFFEPTIVTDAQDGMRIVDEEQFGPALPIVAYSDVDDAIGRANRGHFGLSASVWSTDIERATAIASQLDCGTAYVNQHFSILPSTPFGGAKWSGLGVENGLWGLQGFTALQTMNVNRALA